MCKRLIYLTCFVLALVVLPPVTQAQVENLALNPSFEEDEVILNDPAWQQWATWGWESGLNSTVEIDETEFADGTRSLRIIPKGEINWYFILLYLSVPCEVGQNYTASFWVKADEPRPLAARFKATDNSVDWGLTDFQVTSEWAEYAMTSAAVNASVKFEIFCAGSEVPFWVDFVYVYKGGYIAGIEPSGAASPGKAARPDPADGAVLEQTWVTLSWRAGAFASSHDVYVGDNFGDVDTGTGDTFRGNQGSTFYVAGFPGYAYPDGLVPGTTYYWRIDEVNEADPNSPWKGDVWSFSIPPKTAYHPDPADGAEFVDLNVTLSWTPGFGAKLHYVYFGDDFDDISNAAGAAPSGIAAYTPGPLQSEKVYYWRVDEFDGVSTYKGDIWAFTTPGAVGNPQPANGAVDVAFTQILNWTRATNATSHQVYLGIDKDAVRNADTGSPEYKGSAALGSESLDPGKLAWHAKHYWRVDAVHNAGPVKGPVWSFTTADFIAVDDFESYSDDDAAGEAIWQTWIDGFGIADNGAQVGYLLPPYAEQTVVHGGTQSMPLLYTNEAGVTNSEAALMLTKARDWTEEGVGEVSLWIRGNVANAAEPLYVAVSNAAGTPAVVAHEDANTAQAGRWTQWVISLQTFADKGINLRNVDKIAIGLGSKSGMASPGGSGTIYVDDIRLYRPAP